MKLSGWPVPYMNSQNAYLFMSIYFIYSVPILDDPADVPLLDNYQVNPKEASDVIERYILQNVPLPLP